MGSRLNNKNKTRDDNSFKRKSETRKEFSEDRYKEICFNFQYLDKNQGQSYKEWEENKILALMLNKLEHLSKLNIMEAQKGILTIYKDVDFPPESNFTSPEHVTNNFKFPDDAKWSSIRVQGEERVIGFIKENIFYIVFLDKNHDFWISKKKHT